MLLVRTEDCESPLHLHLGQVMSRGEKMEFTIQKSIKLRVNVIMPLFSERCGVKLEGERLGKKLQKWRKIAIGICEQCGRIAWRRPPRDEALGVVCGTARGVKT